MPDFDSIINDIILRLLCISFHFWHVAIDFRINSQFEFMCKLVFTPIQVPEFCSLAHLCRLLTSFSLECIERSSLARSVPLAHTDFTFTFIDNLLFFFHYSNSYSFSIFKKFILAKWKMKQYKCTEAKQRNDKKTTTRGKWRKI